MEDRTTEVLARYARGAISAGQAADELGPSYSVADVYVMSRKAGLPLPDDDGPFERTEFDRARRLFGGNSKTSDTDGKRRTV